MFSGDEYLRYDMDSDQVESGYPRKIAYNWPDVSEIIPLDGAVMISRSLHFISDNSVVSFDMEQNVGSGPKDIETVFPGAPR